jgi:hypothetical protein
MKIEGEVLYRSENASEDNVNETLAFGNAIMQAIADVSAERTAEGKDLTFTGLVGALANVMAHFIGGVSDFDQRVAHFQSLGHQLADMIEICAARGDVAELNEQKDLH